MPRIYFTTESSMVKALESISRIITVEGCITVNELYDIVGIASPYDHTFGNIHGWTTTERMSTEVASASPSWAIVLPEPDRLNALGLVIKAEPDDKMVSHPPHYQSETGLEAIDVIEAFTFDLKGIEATDAGNVLKYMCRWKSKNGLQDLKKAKWYLEHLINHVEKLEKEND